MLRLKGHCPYTTDEVGGGRRTTSSASSRGARGRRPPRRRRPRRDGDGDALRPTSLKISNSVPISTISELYSSYDDEKLNRHHLTARHLATSRPSSCSSSSVSSLASSIIDMTMYKKRSISSRNLATTANAKEASRKQLPVKYRNNKSLGGGLDRLGIRPKEAEKRNSYMKNFCLAVSCAKQSDSTYRQMKLNSTIDSYKQQQKKKSFSSSRGASSSSPFGPRPNLTHNERLCQEIKFVSTDEYDEDDGHFKRTSRREGQSGRIECFSVNWIWIE